MLLEIKAYLSEQKTANLQELSLHFKKQPDTMRCMLRHWVCKGKVCYLSKPAGCGSRCQQCLPTTTEIYQWIG